MKISVIVPAYNASATLPPCLKSIFEQADADTEIVVVDDCSTDNTLQIARDSGTAVFQTQQQSGPAGGRNLGAEKSTGDILFFVDADVVIGPGSIGTIKRTFESDPSLAAVFGSYDEAPAQQNFLSQYKNLLHHFVHQESSSNAGTFWAGCGAIRKEVFHSVDGFDAQRYPYPSIEDIELGIRMVGKGYRIRLDKDLQGKHLKRWSVHSLLKADILHRAYPWSRLIASHGDLPKELNLKIYHRISGALAILLVLSCVLASLKPSIWTIGTALFCLLGLLVLNRNVYSFFLHKKGFLFLIAVIFWHTLYYFYSTITFGYCWIRFRLLGKNMVPSRRQGVHARHET